MPKIAIVHDWLVEWRGSERVLGELLRIFPDADVYAAVDFLATKDRAQLNRTLAGTTMVQHLPWAQRWFRHYLMLFPWAISGLDLSAYDLVISSSHAFAKGVLTGPDQRHLCYCHSPMRYVWDMQNTYLQQAGWSQGLRSWLMGWPVRGRLARLREWDYLTAQSVDAFAANSDYIARRIAKYYRRSAQVIYPPVDLSRFQPATQREGFYLTVSRLVPYKRVDILVEAFRHRPDRELWVVGDGPEAKYLRDLASSNIRFLGALPDAEIADLMSKAKAFLFAAEEDFGIVPVEAQAAGAPVIALSRGGTAESVLASPHLKKTGVHFHQQTAAAVQAAIAEFEALEVPIQVQDCVENATRFSVERFHRQIQDWVDEGSAAKDPKRSKSIEGER